MNMLVRKCSKCDNPIEIDVDNIHDIINYGTLYYHKNCFIEKATKLSKTSRTKKEEWQYALEHIDELEKQTYSKLWHYYWRDQLNNWILDNYNIPIVPRSFFTTIADIENGKYKGKRCKPTSVKLIFETWQWGQRNLDKININNKKNHRGPKDDSERIIYDLSIVLSKVPNYLAHKSKMQVIEANTVHDTEKIEINYSNFERKTEVNMFDDISALLDEI